MAAMSTCVKVMLKKKEKRIHCDQEGDFTSEEGEARYLCSVAKPGTKLRMVFPNKNRLRTVLLRRAVVDEEKPMDVALRKKFDFRPVLSRFGLEFKGLLPKPKPQQPQIEHRRPTRIRSWKAYMKTLKECAVISKPAGGICVDVHNIVLLGVIHVIHYT
ncbi:hypothetical protein P3L10_005285 [Capsicum annuum]